MTFDTGLLRSSDISQQLGVTGLYGTENGCGMFTEVSTLILAYLQPSKVLDCTNLHTSAG